MDPDSFSPLLPDWLRYPAYLLYLGFWLWMLIHCVRNDPERGTWLWLLIILQGIGPVVYFFARYLPTTRANAALPGFKWIRRLTSGRKLARLRHAARHIGNPHQWVELGDLQRDLGQTAEAAESYRQALKKDPVCLPALWGAAQTEAALRNFPEARQHLQTILGRDFAYKFGDVSLAYGRTLVELKEPEAARTHLATHLQRWTHPEAHLLMAQLLAEAGEAATARRHLETLLDDLEAAPAFFARQHRKWGSKARTLLKTL